MTSSQTIQSHTTEYQTHSYDHLCKYWLSMQHHICSCVSSKTQVLVSKLRYHRFCVKHVSLSQDESSKYFGFISKQLQSFMLVNSYCILSSKFCGGKSQSITKMKSTKVQNPRRILHIFRSMPTRVHRVCAGGFDQKLYACALFIIDGLGHATWSSKIPVSRSGMAPF